MDRPLVRAWPLLAMVLLPVPAWPGPPPDPDGDGFALADGDCCESTADGCTLPAAVNPGAMDAPGNDLDDDCDGLVDEAEGSSCDTGLALDSTNPADGASSIDLCRSSTGPQAWGLVSAAYTRSSGTPAVPGSSVGLQADFGPNVVPAAGNRLLALSTGVARLSGQPGSCGTSACSILGDGVPPAGFPQDVPGCPSASPDIADDPALQLLLRAPSNAVGFRLRYAFYTFDWPEWVCTQYNDQMLVLMAPPPSGSIAGNLAFDAQSRPVGAAMDGITVCDPAGEADYASACAGAGCPSPPQPYCPDGVARLLGTGFDALGSAGATQWLSLQAPVGPLQEFQLRLTVFDVGDTTLDSTALFDGFEWLLEPSQLVAVFADGFEDP